MELLKKEGITSDKDNKDYIDNMIEDINRNQKELINIINNYLNNQTNKVIVENIDYDKDRLKILTIIWATYLGTLGTLKTKYLTDDDLKFLKIIFPENGNKNLNEDINFFAKIIKALYDFYMSLHNNKTSEKRDDIIEKESNKKVEFNINNDKEEINGENNVGNNNSNNSSALKEKENIFSIFKTNDENELIKNSLNNSNISHEEEKILSSSNNINKINGENEIKINNLNNNNIFHEEEKILLSSNKKNEISNENEIKIDNSNKNKIIYEEEKKFTSCIFCIEDFDENEITNPVLDCTKHVHGKCFSTYIEHELNNNRFPIKCPLCTDVYSHDINYKIIYDCLILNDKEKMAIKLENISLNRLSETNPDEVSFCPTPGCSYMCFYDINEYHLDCPLCKKSYCLKCKTEWHQDLTCEEYQQNKKYEENMTEEDKLNEKKFEDYVRGNRCKQCPKCKRWVEKNRGCDHITCPCGTHFCYKCGQLRDPIRPYDHKCNDNILVNNNNNNNFFDDFNNFNVNRLQRLTNNINNNINNNIDNNLNNIGISNFTINRNNNLNNNGVNLFNNNFNNNNSNNNMFINNFNNNMNNIFYNMNNLNEMNNNFNKKNYHFNKMNNNFNDMNSNFKNMNINFNNNFNNVNNNPFNKINNDMINPLYKTTFNFNNSNSSTMSNNFNNNLSNNNLNNNYNNYNNNDNILIQTMINGKFKKPQLQNSIFQNNQQNIFNNNFGIPNNNIKNNNISFNPIFMNNNINNSFNFMSLNGPNTSLPQNNFLNNQNKINNNDNSNSNLQTVQNNNLFNIQENNNDN